jgi:hypothetical protein
MLRRMKRSPWLAAAVLAGMIPVGGSALSTAASAAEKEPSAPKAACTYADQSYSDGSVRSQEVTYPNGSKETTYYKCNNGSWEPTGTPMRPAPPSTGRSPGTRHAMH